MHPSDIHESWFGFRSLVPLDGLPCKMLMISLPGHTFGHRGIALQDGGKWLVAGDACFYHREMNLRQLRHDHGSEIEIFCSHDMGEFKRLARRACLQPAEAAIKRP